VQSPIKFQLIDKCTRISVSMEIELQKSWPSIENKWEVACFTRTVWPT